MRIISLTAENVQRLSVVEIKPDGSSLVIVAGANEAGKSSCLDAIEMALGGKDALPTEPVRRGAAKGRVVLDLGDFIVTRTFQPSGGTSLKITNRDGANYPSPQALLDGLLSRLTFDPLAFAVAKPADQAMTLRALAKLDTSDLDLARQKAFDDRTDVNREVARLKGAIEKAPFHEGIGTEPESIDDITAHLAEADRLAGLSAKAERELAEAESARKAAEGRVERAEKALDAARVALERAEEEDDAARMALAVAEDTWRAKADESGIAEQAIPDRTALRNRIGDIQIRNHRAAMNKARVDLSAQLTDQQAKADALTSTITAVDATKAERLAAAEFPVEGLGLDEHGVTWHGLPFDQASTAIRTRVSVAIGAALNPKLKVLLIRNGNDLDAKNLTLLASFADEHGLQLWVERIAGGDGFQTVVIEDGAVREAVTA